MQRRGVTTDGVLHRFGEQFNVAGHFLGESLIGWSGKVARGRAGDASAYQDCGPTTAAFVTRWRLRAVNVPAVVARWPRALSPFWAVPASESVIRAAWASIRTWRRVTWASTGLVAMDLASATKLVRAESSSEPSNALRIAPT
jgi:hypothetical protein